MINIMVQFILLIFIFIIFFWVSMLKFISGKKIRDNTEEASFGIPGEITGPRNNIGVELIVKSKIGFMMETNR